MMASANVMMWLGAFGRSRWLVGGACVVSVAEWWSFGGDFGDGGSGAGFVDDALVGGVGGDEGLDGRVVHGAGQPTADLVDQGDRVVAE